MLSFGKGKKVTVCGNHSANLRSRWPSVGNRQGVTPEMVAREYSRGGNGIPKHRYESGVEIHWVERSFREECEREDENDNFTVPRSLRENREWTAWLNERKKVEQVLEDARRYGRFMTFAMATAEVNKNKKKKPKRRNIACDIYVERYLESEEKIAIQNARDHHPANPNYLKRNAKSWKSCGGRNTLNEVPTSELESAKKDTKLVPIGGKRLKARKAWGTKFNLPRHEKIGMRQAMAESYIVFLREYDAWRKENGFQFLRDLEYNDADASAEEVAYWEMIAALDELEARYEFGRWNLRREAAPVDPIELLVPDEQIIAHELRQRRDIGDKREDRSTKTRKVVTWKDTSSAPRQWACRA